jgi:succinate dehydrogenase / fumarate reductase flavoprotein subunit
MGGVEVDPDTAAALVPGLFAAGEVSGGMHGSNRLGGNSLSDLLVFGRRAGAGAAAYVDAISTDRPAVDEAQVTASVEEALAPFAGKDGENPYTVQSDLQQTMNDLVGIIRRADEIEQALLRLDELKQRATRVGAPGARPFNPGWHVALDLRNLLIISECVAKAALARQESRGGHTRDDYPQMSPEWRRVNLVCSLDPTGTSVEIKQQPLPVMPKELLELFDKDELSKYLTADELSILDSADTEGGR